MCKMYKTQHLTLTKLLGKKQTAKGVNSNIQKNAQKNKKLSGINAFNK